MNASIVSGVFWSENVALKILIARLLNTGISAAVRRRMVTFLLGCVVLNGI